jgi:hypothetical protein
VLRDIPLPAPVEVSMPFESFLETETLVLPESSSGIAVMDCDPPGNHAECEAEADLGQAEPENTTVDNFPAKYRLGSENAATLEVDSDTGDEEQTEVQYEKIGTYRFVPTIAEAKAAFEDIKQILKPSRKKGPGYVHHGLDDFTHSRIEAMRKFLWKYVAGNSTACWIPIFLETANDHGRGPYHARLLREWTHGFIANKDLPKNIYGTWNTSMLDNEDLAQAIHLHLQTLGPWIRAQDVVDFIKRPETLALFELKKPISLATAHQWMKR